MSAEQHDSWDDPKYVKPADCDELGYCVDCRSATIHRDGCIVLTGNLVGRPDEYRGQ